MEDMVIMGKALDEASKYGLTVEVLVSALEAQRNHPEYTLSEALEAGLNEWIK